MDHAQQCLELESIKQLKARYFRCMDTKDWEGWRRVFTDDASIEFDLAVSTLGRPGEPAPKLVGREAILAYVSQAFATNQTVHHGHTPEIELLSETRARGIWAMEDSSTTAIASFTATATTTRPTRRSAATGGSPRCTSPASACPRSSETGWLRCSEAAQLAVGGCTPARKVRKVIE